MSNFAQARSQARRDVHVAFAVPVFYTPKGASAPLTLAAPGLTARLHNKIALQADPMGQTAGYAQILEGVTRVIFNREELTAFGIAPARGDLVNFPDYGMSVILDNRDPVNGPIVDKWYVSPA